MEIRNFGAPIMPSLTRPKPVAPDAANKPAVKPVAPLMTAFTQPVIRSPIAGLKHYAGGDQPAEPSQPLDEDEFLRRLRTTGISM